MEFSRGNGDRKQWRLRKDGARWGRSVCVWHCCLAAENQRENERNSEESCWGNVQSFLSPTGLAKSSPPFVVLSTRLIPHSKSSSARFTLLFPLLHFLDFFSVPIQSYVVLLLSLCFVPFFFFLSRFTFCFSGHVSVSVWILCLILCICSSEFWCHLSCDACIFWIWFIVFACLDFHLFCYLFL